MTSALLLAAAMWISPDADPEEIRVAAFRRDVVNRAAVKRAEWRITSLGVFNGYVNGRRIGDDWLAPGCTYNVKCRHEATYDVTAFLDRSAGATNALAVEVGPPWWCDAIAKKYGGRRCALRATLTMLYADGRVVETPTCPQRDERAGWAGDTQVFCLAAMYHADVYEFLMKWLADQRDTQREDGAISEIAPKCMCETCYGQCGWADSAVIVPYTLWKMYGRTEPLELHWDAMTRHMAFAEKNGLGDNYCDWLSPVRNDAPLKALLCDAFVVWDAQMMREMAMALGKGADAARYGRLAHERREAWRAKYLDGEGAVCGREAGLVVFGAERREGYGPRAVVDARPLVV